MRQVSQTCSLPASACLKAGDLGSLKTDLQVLQSLTPLHICFFSSGLLIKLEISAAEVDGKRPNKRISPARVMCWHMKPTNCSLELSGIGSRTEFPSSGPGSGAAQSLRLENAQKRHQHAQQGATGPNDLTPLAESLHALQMWSCARTEQTMAGEFNLSKQIGETWITSEQTACGQCCVETSEFQNTIFTFAQPNAGNDAAKLFDPRQV